MLNDFANKKFEAPYRLASSTLASLLDPHVFSRFELVETFKDFTISRSSYVASSYV